MVWLWYMACDEQQDKCAGVCLKTFATHRNVSHTMLAILQQNICSTPQCIAHNVSHFTTKHLQHTAMYRTQC
jgi:hypothetical protein